MDWISLINSPVGILAALVAVVVTYFGGKIAGRTDSDRKHQQERADEALAVARDIIQETTTANAAAHENRETVRNLPSNDALDRLRREFPRNPPRR